MANVKIQTDSGWKNLVVPFENGGLNGDNRADSFNNLTFLGVNPIGKGNVSKDTYAYWKNMGTGYCFFDTWDQLNGQPTSSGFLLSIVNGTEIHQEWKDAVGGAIYRRGGNGNNIGNNNAVNLSDWVRICDAVSIMPVWNGGTNANSIGVARDNLGFKITTLWTGSAANGANITIPNSTNYSIMGVEGKVGSTNLTNKILFGCRRVKTGSAAVSFFGAYDDGSQGFTIRATFQPVNGNDWTLKAASRHDADGSDAISFVVTKIYGIC